VFFCSAISPLVFGGFLSFVVRGIQDGGTFGKMEGTALLANLGLMYGIFLINDKNDHELHNLGNE